MAAGGTSVAPEKIAKLSAALRESLRNPDVIRKLEELGMEATPSNPKEMSSYVKQEQTRWSALIKARGISNK